MNDILKSMLASQDTDSLNAINGMVSDILNERASAEAKQWTGPTFPEILQWREGKVAEAIKSYRSKRPTIDLRVAREVFRIHAGK